MLPKTLALLLVPALASAGLGGAVLTGHAPFLATAPAPASEPPAGWEVLEQFGADVDPGIVAGTLDLRTFAGPVHVVGWEEARYEVVVLQRVGDAKGPSDTVVEATFTEEAGDVLGLSLSVVPKGTYDLDFEDHWPPVAVQVSVPSSIAWTKVHVCSAMSGTWAGVGDLLGGLVGRGKEHSDCVEAAEPIGSGISIQVSDDNSDEAEAIPLALSNLQGGELLVMADYSDLGAEALTFGKAELLTQYGSIHGQLDAPELVALTQYGNVELTTAVNDLTVLTQYGHVVLQVVGGGSGAYDVQSEYGSILIRVPPSAGERGYDVEAMTQYGEAVIDLEGTETAAPEEDHQERGLGLPTLLKAGPAAEPKPMRGEGSMAHARTEGFEDMPVQVTIHALTEYGDVLVTDKEPKAEN